MSVRFDNYKGSDETPITGSNLTEVDSLFFAELSYYRFESDKIKAEFEALQADGSSIKLRQYVELAKIVETNPSKLQMLNALASDPRYANCTVDFMESKYSEETGNIEQWAAITINLNDRENTAVMSFRGTDATYVGWQEDFEMAYSPTTNAQQSSADYLAEYARTHPEANIILTGHSKGGNDAVYAYLASDDTVRGQVSHIYNYDGPSVMGNNAAKYAKAYSELDKKLDTYCPQNSVIGMLLKDHGNIHYVYSDGDNKPEKVPILGEHDAFTWYINENGSFQFTEQSEFSKFVNATLDNVVNSLTPKQLERVMTVLAEMGVFKMIAGTGDPTLLTELASEDKKFLEKIMLTYSEYDQLDGEEKQALIDFVSILLFSAEYEGGLDLLEPIIHEKINSMVEQAQKKILDISLIATPILALFGVPPYVTLAFGGFINLVVAGLGELGKVAVSYFISKIKGRGSNKIYSQDSINVNFNALNTVISDLQRIQRIIQGLDGKLDNFRKNLHAWEVLDKAQAAAIDFTMTGSSIAENVAEHLLNEGYDWEVSACIRYLNAVITELQQNENNIIAKAGGLS